MKPTVGSLFAGIGGFDLGFERAGFETVWQVEREPFCIAVLKTHFPNVERYYDILRCGHDRINKLKRVDIICAGVPCQDVSVAGKRAGLKGERTGLFYEFARILREIRPTWFVFENVPGLLSSNGGRDFAEILRVLMVECGYGVCWRVLDSQFFGVAQRRRRVFIVGCFGKPCPAEVLFEPEGGEGDFTQSGEKRPELAFEIAASLRGVGGTPRGFNLDAEQGLAVTVAHAISASAGHHGHSSPRALKARTGGFDIENAAAGYAVAFAQNQRGELRTSRIMPQLTTGGGKPGEGYPAVLMPNSQHEERSGQQFNSAREVDGAMRGNDYECAPADSNGVRDFASLPEGMDSARYPLLPEGQDSARYRALGNAVTVSVARWIASRIRRIHEAVDR